MTTLLVARQKFCQLSGRPDLALPLNESGGTTEFGTDNGADFFITAGQDYLDRLQSTPKEQGRIFDSVAINAWYLTFQKSRAIMEVWVNSDKGRWELEKVSLGSLKKYYASLRADTDSGQVAYYAPASLRAIDAADIDDKGAFFNYIMAASDDYNGIIFMPPTEEALVVEIVGKFYSDTLSSNSSQSFWTQNHMMTLVWSALRQLEISYRNTEGARDWKEAIDESIVGIDKDVVEEIIADTEEMDG